MRCDWNSTSHQVGGGGGAEEVRRNALRLEFQQPPGEGGKGGWMSPYLGPRPPR